MVELQVIKKALIEWLSNRTFNRASLALLDDGSVYIAAPPNPEWLKQYAEYEGKKVVKMYEVEINLVSRKPWILSMRFSDGSEITIRTIRGRAFGFNHRIEDWANKAYEEARKLLEELVRKAERRGTVVHAAVYSRRESHMFSAYYPIVYYIPSR